MRRRKNLWRPTFQGMMCCAVQPYASGNVCPLIGQYFPQCLLSCNRAPKIVQSCHPGWENINLKNMENMEKMENIIQMTKNTRFHGIYGNGWKIITYVLGDHGPRSLFSYGNIFRSFQYLWNRFPKLLASIFHYVSIFHVFCLIHFNILIHGLQTFSPLFSIMSAIL